MAVWGLLADSCFPKSKSARRVVRDNETEIWEASQLFFVLWLLASLAHHVLVCQQSKENGTGFPFSLMEAKVNVMLRTSNSVFIKLF